VLHHTTRAKNGRANWRGCVKKAPFGATLSPETGDFVRLDGNGRVNQVTPVVNPPSGEPVAIAGWLSVR